MKRRIVFFLLSLFWMLSAKPAAADKRFIVRNPQGWPSCLNICDMENCTVVKHLDGASGQVFLLSTSDDYDSDTFLTNLHAHIEVVNAEEDQVVRLHQTSSPVPSALLDSTPIDYFGSVVRHGYVNQPAAQIIRLSETQNSFKVSGAGVVAVIDTGVDPLHPALESVLLPGRNFIQDVDGHVSELADLNQSTMAVVDQSTMAVVDQSTMAVVDQSTMAVVDQSTMAVVDYNFIRSLLRDRRYRAFGHGTMVAGIVHLVAPTAWIMPLKAFQADGTAYLSDILQAIHYAVEHKANVINMSFDFPSYSQEMMLAINLARQNGSISVAAAGNQGKEIVVYPAGYASLVMGVASTTNYDTRALFSNYGPSLVWVAAPGVGIVTTFPFSTYAAAWGTSFSAPFVSGGAALLVQVHPKCRHAHAASALGHARWISPMLGHGRIDLYEALSTEVKNRGNSQNAPGKK